MGLRSITELRCGEGDKRPFVWWFQGAESEAESLEVSKFFQCFFGRLMAVALMMMMIICAHFGLSSFVFFPSSCCGRVHIHLHAYCLPAVSSRCCFLLLLLLLNFGV